MAIDPILGKVGLSLIGGLFGRKKNRRLKRAQAAALEQQTRAAKLQGDIAERLKRFSESAPLTDPQERLALAQARGLLGGEQRLQQSKLLEQLGPNLQSANNLGDFMRNLTTQQVGQRVALSSRALMDALARRQQALRDAAGVSRGAGATAASIPQTRTPETNFSSLFGELAQTLAERQARPKDASRTGGGGTTGVDLAVGLMGNQAAQVAGVFSGAQQGIGAAAGGAASAFRSIFKDVSSGTTKSLEPPDIPFQGGR